ncbi:uncharacterized protein DS421_13g417840 [Arachis hypogaea]|nr:uncharacterized protein DS421_13g417840 [Arachis hypogaea]
MMNTARTSFEDTITTLHSKFLLSTSTEKSVTLRNFHPLVPLSTRKREVSTNGCYDLKNMIEKLAREGQLERYLAKRSDDLGKRKRGDKDRNRQDRPLQIPDRHIHMIVGGLARGGVTKSSRKRYLKEVYHVSKENEVLNLSTISFTREDTQRVTPSPENLVVITMILPNVNLHKTLVDQGSLADILFKPAFDKLGLEEKELRVYPDNLFGLGDAHV